MQGFLKTLATGFVIEALGAALGGLLLAAPMRKAVRAQLKKIYVLNEMGDMDGEYVLDPDCPIDYDDFLKVLPDEGIGDREALFVGEYVFTAFTRGKLVFVLLSRGQLGREDMDWTAALLSAADAHLVAEAQAKPAPHAPEAPGPSPEVEAALSERQAKVDAREKELATLEVQLKADQANLNGRAEELARQKGQLAALADYVAQMQQGLVAGLDRSHKTLEMAEQIASSAAESRTLADTQSLDRLRQQFDDERKALVAARDEVEAKYREAAEKVRQLEAQAQASAEAVAKERAEVTAREAEAERLRGVVEARVQELSQRFAAMAKDRIVASHRPTPTQAPPDEAGDLEKAKAQVANERKFLQRRAVEMLDREEKVRDREMALEGREVAVAKREQDLTTKEATLSKVASTAAPLPADADEARKDIELRVKIIQQKALELLDREEKLRRRAAELEALEARLSGNVPAQ